jgi:hypothetical protein
MMEPASTVGAWAKITEAVKDWPLWLFVGVALSLSLFLGVPDFRGLVSPSVMTGVMFAAAVAWILTASRAVAQTFLAWRAWQAASEARVKFVVTPIEQQCFWGVSKQVDGSFVTQVTGRFMVKNRTASPLYLMTVRLLRPRIRGEILPGLLTMQAIDSNMHGTAHVSGHFIPPQYTLPVSTTILIRGVPKQKSGMMDATIEIADADANKGRVRLKIRCIMPESPA